MWCGAAVARSESDASPYKRQSQVWTSTCFPTMSVSSDASFAPALADCIHAHPGHHVLVEHLLTLYTASPPPFVYLEDPVSARLTFQVVLDTIRALRRSNNSPSDFDFAVVNALSCLQPRILYDTVLNALGGGMPSWISGCINYPCTSRLEGEGQRWNDGFDGFVAGLRNIWHIKQQIQPKKLHFIILVENAERLRDRVASVVNPLTNLKELVCLLLLIMIVRWSDHPLHSAAYRSACLWYRTYRGLSIRQGRFH